MSEFAAVAAESDVARFLFTGHTKNGRVRANAFMPRADDLHLSVCVTDGLSPEETHSWGLANVSTEGRDAKGFALLHVKDVIAEKLIVTLDNDPCRHADVHGWPSDKEARMDIAKQLQRVATVNLR